MIKDIQKNITKIILSDAFVIFLVTGFIALLISFAFGFAAAKKINLKKCNEMSINESLNYPVCRDYLKEELERIENE